MNKLKALLERRSLLLAEMATLLSSLETKTDDGKTEVRAFTDEEQRSYDEKYAEVQRLNDTINSIQQQRSIEINENVGDNSDNAQNEERAFVEYLRSGKGLETRADANWTNEANGAVIPTSIANKIIEKIEELSPVFRLATKYNVGGTLNIPYYDETSGAVTMAYADEFEELESTSGKFLSIQLGGFLAGALCKVSKKLMNNSKFDILGYVIKKVAQAAARWIDGELLGGTSDKITGLSTVTQIVPAAASTAVTADELIDVQEAVLDEYQGEAIWVMSKNTRKAIRKLKDGDGNLLLNKDATAKWGYTLFGKDVYVASRMPDMEAGKFAIYYGDFAGLAIKVSEDLSVEVLREKYATQHAVGVVAWMEMDSKVENAQMISALQMKA
ncbi:MAG: phage major capsid protein [Oscillospiraceae bacterium]|nr:phage major capsid protein [Oscillospiraceae bacterium]